MSNVAVLSTLLAILLAVLVNAVISLALSGRWRFSDDGTFGFVFITSVLALAATWVCFAKLLPEPGFVMAAGVILLVPLAYLIVILGKRFLLKVIVPLADALVESSANKIVWLLDLFLGARQ